MIKFKFDIDNSFFNDLTDGLQSRFNSAVGTLFQDTANKAKTIATTKLKVGLKHWNEGFKLHKVSDDFYIISVEGQLATWMEDGIQVGEISKAIMQGNRAELNKSEGKNYVDVPIAKDADAVGNITLGKKGPTINVKAFADADSLTKYITSSNWKQGGIKKEKRTISRVQDVIKSTKVETSETSYLTIRRVTDKSKWPKTPFKGAKVFEELDSYIEENFDKILERFL